jgi:hypothetical protein
VDSQGGEKALMEKGPFFREKCLIATYLSSSFDLDYI